MPAALPAILAVHAPTAAQVAQQLARETRRCSGKLTVTGDGVGALRVGASVAQVRKVCRIPRVRLKKGQPPPPDNVLDFKIGPTPVQAEIEGGRVWRVIIDGSQLKTADKLGVGSPLSALLASAPARASEGEGVIYAATARHCGLGFQLDYRPRRGEDRDAWTADALAALPKDVKISRVLISGCQAR
jgi:hypothetical protein